MKAKTFITTAVLLWSYALTNAITTSGEITGSETWSGTVLLTGDVTVTATGNLTILPGTRIECRPRSDDQVAGNDTSRIEIIVSQGILNAEGNETELIVFTSASATPGKGDWYGIRINSGTTTLRYCTVEYGQEGLRIGKNSSVSDCTIQKCSSHGVHFLTSGEISRCTVRENGGNGVSSVSNVTIKLSECLIERNAVHGIGTAGTQVIATGCVISNNIDIGVSVTGGFTNTVALSGCTIADNGGRGVNVGCIDNVGGSTGNRNTGTLTNCTISGNGGIGVHVTSGGNSINVGTLSGCRITNNSGIGISVNSSHDWDTSTPNSATLTDCSITANRGTGVSVTSGINGARITNSTINYNNGLGIDTGTLSLEDSIVQGNADIGVWLTSIGSSGFSDNLITSNNIGIVVSSSAAKVETIENGCIFGNTQYEIKNEGSAAVITDGIFWGEPTTTQLRNGVINLSKIYDSQDNTAVGQVVLRNWKEECPILPNAPAITTQPQSQSAVEGGNVSFTVAATGTAPLAYQWRKDGVNLTDGGRISGATTVTLSISTVEVSDGGDYTVVVSNSVGTVTSDAATLTVTAPLPAYHTADYRDPRWKIDGTEVNRVLSYWRAGAYHLEPAGADGYASGTGDTNGQLHSADFREVYWKIDGTEANRVLAYWRAGAYHPDSAGLDGYASGPEPGAAALHAAALENSPTATLTQATVPQYSAGATIQVTNRFEFSGTLESFLLRPLLPVNWVLGAVTGDGQPQETGGEIILTAAALSSPLQIVYEAQVPAGETGNKEIRVEVEYQFSGDINPSTGMGQPNPLQLRLAGPVGPIIAHQTSPEYLPGTTLLVTNRFEFSGTLESFLLRPLLPPNWTLGAVSGDGQPQETDGEIILTAAALSSPLQIVYEAQVPAGETGEKDIRAEVEFQFTGQINPTTAVAMPDPLHVVAGGALNEPPTVHLTSPVTGAAFVAPANIGLEATATDSDGSVVKVEFYEGTNKLGEDTTAPFEYAWSGVGAGTYGFTARATDNGGAVATSAPVTVTVTEGGIPRIVRIGIVTGSPGAVVAVPVSIEAQGNENTIGASLSWDPAKLMFETVAKGSSLGATASFQSNTNGASEGVLGVLAALSAGESLPKGSYQIAVVTLRIAADTASGAEVPVLFADAPVVREVVSPSVEILPAVYADGAVKVQAGFEADVAPRPNGDERLTPADYTQQGRIVAGLVLMSELSDSEFVRADCAPRSSLGDGRISPADWTQAGRYVVGLDEKQAAGGPPPQSAGVASLHGLAAVTAAATDRVVKVADVSGAAGSVIEVPVEIAAQGNENTVGLSLSFDPTVLTYEATTQGNLPADSSLIVNDTAADQGRLGVLVALPSGQNLSAGVHELVRLSFQVGMPPVGLASTIISTSDEPVVREVVSADVEILPTEFQSGGVTFGPDEVLELGLELYAGVTITGTVGRSCRLEFKDDLNAPTWTPLATVQLTQSPQLWIDTTTPVKGKRFYRAVLVP